MVAIDNGISTIIHSTNNDIADVIVVGLVGCF